MAEHFRIIGLKTLEPTHNEVRNIHWEKVESIHRALHNRKGWLFFYNGITIDEETDRISMTKEALYDFSLFDVGGMKVSVSAIVGKNGAGKSSVVDLIIRMINNLSAAALGEGFNFAAAEHLHFIDYVYGSLCFQIGRIVYILEERGRDIKLYSYERHRWSGNDFILRENETVIVLDGNYERDQLIPIKKNPRGRNLLRRLFYTLVCNYSLYGFNYRDYMDEATPIERLKAIYGETTAAKLYMEDKVWLKGIFHKNDGYQTPVVLHPMRDDGMLDMVRENELAKERLISLQFYQDTDANYPFRTINGNLKVVAFKISEKKHKNFSKEGQKMLEHIGISRTRNVSKNFEAVYDVVLQFWANEYDIETDLNTQERLDAYDYIVYKTLKIVFNYKKYQPIFNYMSKTNFDANLLTGKLKPLAMDFSHVTRKLRRTLAYLKSSIYHADAIYFNLNELDSTIDLYIREFEYELGNKLKKIDFLPPPIYDLDLVISKYPEQNGTFTFSGLSSGERQLAYTISNCMYHLVNVNSSWEDLYNDKDHRAQIKYKYVNVIFDEVELYYHPEMQRQFIYYLMQSLKSVHFEHLKGINIILATHSPFILSDIPLSNILRLGDGDMDDSETYGANIIDILGSSFFLDATIGEEVKRKLKHIACIYQHKEDPIFIEDYRKQRNYIKQIVSRLGDAYLKEMMMKMCKELDKLMNPS